MPNRFHIIRKDLNLDPVTIESEGLTIGRLTGNDLALNHPTVSRTQAGIKDINGDYWIFNLSSANGTLLNGEQIDRTPLADGDLVQIGPFLLTATYVGRDLQLSVEMSVSPLPIETGMTQQLSGIEGGKTVRLDLAALAQRIKPTPGGTRRLSGTGLLTGALPSLDDQALKVFWDKRKREAGKMATDSPLKPHAKRRLGKAQFNWRPTFDLQRPWPWQIFTVAGVVVAVLAVVGAVAYTDAYSPGQVSNPHIRTELTIQPAIAKQPNGTSCSNCHKATASLQTGCTSCHTTEAFAPVISDIHERVGMTCASCHTEHQGRDFRPALVANLACVECHSDASRYVSPLSGKKLGTPHGNSFGYPIEGGRWTWPGVAASHWERKELPGAASDYSVKDQFHLVHIAGHQQRGLTNCSDCHTQGFEGDKVSVGVRESCSACHGMTPAMAAEQSATIQMATDRPPTAAGVELNVGTPYCVSCHAQHGEGKNLRATFRQIGKN
ncbi:MAG: cytochrome c3 family protein [Acidobacteria bacterium]|nr:cytochrome c3 family protein [Acidobacteriota bacterium]MCW5967364.1 cytochrome c3 family protein [Blastocatellales bacterium]